MIGYPLMQEPDPAAVDRRGLPAGLTTAETRGAMQPAPKRSAAEWLFQLTTITLGVLIALAFDAALRWNADRALVAEARATVGREVSANRTELEEHLTTFTERMAQLNNVMTLLDELDAGVEPTVREIQLGASFPTLNDAGWQSAERTGALALMDYAEVQRLAEIYMLQALVTSNASSAFIPLNRAVGPFIGTPDPFAMSPQMRESVRLQVIDLRALFTVDEQLSAQLLESYRNYGSSASADARE